MKKLIILVLIISNASTLFRLKVSIDRINTLENNSVSDSTMIHTSDIVIKDFKNITLKMRNLISNHNRAEKELQNDTSYLNLTSKYN